MPNALTADPIPPAPDPQRMQAQQPMSALMGGPAPGMPSGAPQQPPPAPSHQQTVAALRHMSAVERELTGLLKDPDCGRADMRSKIIDGATSLVAEGMLTPSQAVAQLGTVPERPFEQKQWLMKNYAQTVQAQSAILDQHRAAFAGTPSVENAGSADNHIQTISGLMSMYQGAAPNAR